jgi:hypothetical protein
VLRMVSLLLSIISCLPEVVFSLLRLMAM